MKEFTYHSANLNVQPTRSTQYVQSIAFINPRERLQKLKKQANQAKQYFQSVLSSHIKAQASVQKLKKQQNKIKYNFIKLYETKKGKMDKSRWHQRARNLSQLSNRSLRQKAKSKKLHDEFDKLLRENQQDEKRNYLSTKLYQEKKNIHQKFLLQRKRQLNLAKNSHNVIRETKTSMSMRRKKSENVVLQNSKWNYLEKMTRQARLLKQYELLAHQIEDMNKQIGLNQDQLEILSAQFLITGISKNK